MDSSFKAVELGGAIEVFAVNKQYLDDQNSKKVNLSIGAYRTENGTPWVLPIVREVEKLLANDEMLNHEYLPVLGLESFCDAATKLLLCSTSDAVKEKRAFGIQTLSGTGALRVGATFLQKILNYDTVYISSPSWENHHLLFSHCNYANIRTYRYWDGENKRIDFNGLCEDLLGAPENSVVILHACAHNPTGCDPTKEQWEKIATIMKERRLFPFFDCAYQGFASGSLDADSWAVRHFVEKGFEIFCAQSFAKNFGLYNERIGNLTVVLKDSSPVAAVKSQFQLIVRAMYSNPPAHGARIVSIVLNDEIYYQKWCECIAKMSGRIRSMRESLRKKLEGNGTPGTWNHITDQIGMFSYTGLTEKQVEFLKSNSIYLLKSGRINMCGLNEENLDYVAKKIHEAVTSDN